ncbi:MAG: hypothetical protein ACO3TS_11725, partial [Candidatus Nanopelagicales bacterium]
MKLTPARAATSRKVGRRADIPEEAGNEAITEWVPPAKGLDVDVTQAIENPNDNVVKISTPAR